MKTTLSTMTAHDLMSVPVACVMDETPLQEIAKLLLADGISAAPVLDDAGHLVGIVSEGDLVRRRSGFSTGRRSWWLDMFESDLNQNQGLLNYIQHHGLRARDVMTHDVVTVEVDAPISTIAELLERHRIKRVPVLKGEKVAGIVSRADLLRAIAEAAPPKGRLAHRKA
jgi:CBS domain-containing protein